MAFLSGQEGDKTDAQAGVQKNGQPAGSFERAVFSLAQALLLALVFWSVPLFTSPGFKPLGAMPPDCANGKHQCGLKPLSWAERNSVPEDLANYRGHRGLPEKVDLSPGMPPVGHQGRQGSCVGWAMGYAIKSYHEKRERNWSYGPHVQLEGGAGEHVFSPAFIYNQLNKGRDRGSNPLDALRLLKSKGVAPWRVMPYREDDFLRLPNLPALREALRYRIRDYRRVNHANPALLKAALAAGNPVFIGLKTHDNFYRLGSSEVYDGGKGAFRGGHAAVLVGYDDNRATPGGKSGAYRIYNSWGVGWGDRGYGWISYRSMARDGLGAFVIYDDGRPEPGPRKKKPHVDKDRYPTGDSDKKSETKGAEKRPESEKREEKESPATTGRDDKKKTVRSRGAMAVVRRRAHSIMRSPPLTPVAYVHASRGLKSYIQIAWARSRDALLYRVERMNLEDKKFIPIAYSLTDSYLDRGVIRGRAYRYRIVPLAPAGEGSPDFSPVAEGYAGSGEGRPGQVFGLTWEYGVPAPRPGGLQGVIRLHWRPVPGAGRATRYQVARYFSETKKWRVIARSVRGTRFLDDSDLREKYRTARGVFPARTYRVRALHKRTRGEWSPGVAITPAVSVHPVKLEPASPGPLRVRRKGVSLLLDWKSIHRDKSRNGKAIRAYRIFHKSGPNRGEFRQPWKLVKSLDPGVTRFQIPAPLQGQVQFIRFEIISGKKVEYFILPIFSDPVAPRPKQRLLDDGFNRFKGDWTALDWDGEGEPVKVRLQISRQGVKFRSQLQIGSGSPRSFIGPFVARSRRLVAPRFKLQVFQTGIGELIVLDGQEREFYYTLLKEE